MTNHSFNTAVAEAYGINAAIILEHIGFWIKKNEANGANFYDGNYWTYNSRKALRELFPYMGERQIYGALQKLIAAGLIVTGNYNKSAYDRTMWYALTERGKSIVQYNGFHCTDLHNGSGENAQPIPDINTDIKPDIKHIYKDIISYLNEKAGTAYKETSKATQSHINARLKDGFTADDFKKVIDNKVADWTGTEWEKYLRPETLFGSKFENYLNSKVRATPAPKVEADAEFDALWDK